MSVVLHKMSNALERGRERIFQWVFSRPWGPKLLWSSLTSELRLALFESLRPLVESDPRSLPHGIALFASIHEQIERHARGVAGKRILEIGPGHTLAVGALLVAAGAESYVGADLFPIASVDPALYRSLRLKLAADLGLIRDTKYYDCRRDALARFDEIVRIEDDCVTFAEDRLSWRCPVDASNLPFGDASFDVCISNATLEHIQEPVRAVRESLRILAPGGFGLHQIDFRDHRDFERPLDFLRYSTEDWAKVFDERFAGRLPAELGPPLDPFQYTNRWRRADFVAAFEAAGAEVVHVNTNITFSIAEAVRASLHRDFRDRPREELEALSAFLVVRKPAEGAAPVDPPA